MKKNIKSFLGNAISRLGSASHAVIDSENDIPSYLTYSYVEDQLSTHCALDFEFIAIEDDVHPPDARGTIHSIILKPCFLGKTMYQK